MYLVAIMIVNWWNEMKMKIKWVFLFANTTNWFYWSVVFFSKSINALPLVIHMYCESTHIRQLIQVGSLDIRWFCVIVIFSVIVVDDLVTTSLSHYAYDHEFRSIWMLRQSFAIVLPNFYISVHSVYWILITVWLFYSLPILICQKYFDQILSYFNVIDGCLCQITA